MQYFKKFLLFLLLLALSTGILTLALFEPFTLDIMFAEAQQEGCRSAVFGQSLSQVGINSHLLGTEDGPCYNFSRGAMDMRCVEAMVKEADRVLDLQTVYLNLDTSYWDETDWLAQMGGVEANDAVALYFRSLGHRNTLPYRLAVLKSQPFSNIVTPYTLDAASLRRVPGNLKARLTGRGDSLLDLEKLSETSHNYRYEGLGFSRGIETNVTEDQKQAILRGQDSFSRDFVPEDVPDHALDSFLRIADYCRSQDIRLICFSSANIPELYPLLNYDTAHDYFSGICSMAQVPYYDMSYVRPELLPRSLSDYVDVSCHMMGDLADRQTALLLEITEAENPESYFETDYQHLLKAYP